MNRSWLEIRSTAPGILEPLGYHVKEPPDGSDAWEGIFSFVVDDDETKKTRTLPMLHHGAAQIYADRHLERLGMRLNRALEAVAAVETDATYMANACRLGDSYYGLYTRDLFNRASFRLHMARLGVDFADDPYVRLLPDGRFYCRDWGEFEPAFMVAGGPFPDDPDDVDERTGGLAPFMFGVLRLGRITAPELAHLGRFVRRARILSSQSPRAIVQVLKAA